MANEMLNVITSWEGDYGKYELLYTGELSRCIRVTKRNGEVKILGAVDGAPDGYEFYDIMFRIDRLSRNQKGEE